MALDCGAMPKELAASEFFGHKKEPLPSALTDKTGALFRPMAELFFLMRLET